MNKEIYMDHAGTTAVNREVLDEMLPYFTKNYGNPSSLHKIGREAKKAVDLARDRVAKALGADSSEIYFTSCGSESDNWVIKGIAFANADKGNHIITSVIEHHAVLNACLYLQKHGFDITYLPVDRYGFVSPEDVENAITDKTILITIMTANNEIGTIEPIDEIAAIAKKHNVYFHTDAVQAIGNMKFDVKKQNIDMLSLSAHKFCGPKGIGALYLRKTIKIDSLVHGGEQEKGKRSGTENVPGVVGLGKAIEIADKNMENHVKNLSRMRDMMIKGILKNIPDVQLNGHSEKRLPGNVNISFKDIDGEPLLMNLDMNGIAASAGSACAAGSLNPSHVLTAIGLSKEVAKGSLRLTLGDDNTDEHVYYVLGVLADTVSRLRSISPLFAQCAGNKKYV